MIRVRDLSKRYPSGTVGLDGVSLEVGAGEFVALIGSSGAGKSTLLRCLNGLVIPTAGAVSIDGLPVTGASREGLRSVRASVGFVFQQFNLQRRLSVLDNVQTYLRLLNYPAASTVLLVLVAMVMLVDFGSSRLRARLV